MSKDKKKGEEEVKDAPEGEVKKDGDKKEGEAPKEDLKGAPKGAPEKEGEVEKEKKPKKEKKSRKERKISVKKHTSVQIWKNYEVKDGKAIRKKKICPRCGAGTFMANFKERTYCGKCGYAEMAGRKEDTVNDEKKDAKPDSKNDNKDAGSGKKDAKPEKKE